MTGKDYISEFSNLTRAANEAGLMDRRRGFYWSVIGASLAALAGLLFLCALLGPTWWQLLVAAGVGLVMSQLGFLGHEAAHQEMFRSAAWNEWVGRVLSGLFTGLSYEWWLDKHNRHHANPNKHGDDPDVHSSVLSFTPEATDSRPAWMEALTRRQGYYFLPLLCFEGFYLHYISIRTMLAAPTLKRRWVEITLITVRHAAYLVFLFSVLPPVMALAFLGVQIAVFGFLLGGAFAPNHIGMPTIPHDAEIDFLRRQVLMSRNVRGGPLVHFFMGGLEYQIEHHLFPAAPRPNLPALQRMVQQYCHECNITYTETTLVSAFSTALAYLNQVGLKHRDPFTCPLVRQYRF